jgi:DNA-binding NarL/FixJ family response regulator
MTPAVDDHRLIVAAGVGKTNGVASRRAGVLAVDDNVPFLDALSDVIAATAELESVGEARSGEQAVELAQELEPDIVLIDVWMPGLGGIEAARYIKTRHPTTLVALISTTPPNELPRDAGESGADAVICKSDLDPALLDEIWLQYRSQIS